MERLPELVHLLYAELLDQLRDEELDVVDGSFVSKVIGKGRYWYLQRDDGGRRTQTYLGAESPELLEQIHAAKQRQLDRRHRRQLVSMLIAGGAASEPPAFASVLQVLSESYVFRLGAVLVGTQAFRCYGNMLGVRFDGETLRTADIDVAQNAAISAGIANEASVDLLQRLKAVEPRFAAIPALDPRAPSTSFKVRGRDLRVDFVTIPKRGSRRAPIAVPHLGVAAQPLEGIDYLIEKPVKAAVVGGGGILVNVPQPARYALHKLWLAKTRPISERAKARKDEAQASQLLEVLRADRREDIDAAVRALERRPTLRKRILKELELMMQRGEREGDR